MALSEHAVRSVRSPAERRSEVWCDGIPDASSLHGWLSVPGSMVTRVWWCCAMTPNLYSLLSLQKHPRTLFSQTSYWLRRAQTCLLGAVSLGVFVCMNNKSESGVKGSQTASGSRGDGLSRDAHPLATSSSWSRGAPRCSSWEVASLWHAPALPRGRAHFGGLLVRYPKTTVGSFFD